MNKPRILRRRYIPFETVDITGDELLFRDDKLLITKWKAIKKRTDIFGGFSFTFLEDGYKISRFYDNSGEFIYWYCDIIDVEYVKEHDTYTLVDLLVDIKIMPGGQVRVLDAAELAEALGKGLITQKRACMALINMDKLLKTIYEGTFPPEICRKNEYQNI